MEKEIKGRNKLEKVKEERETKKEKKTNEE